MALGSSPHQRLPGRARRSDESKSQIGGIARLGKPERKEGKSGMVLILTKCARYKRAQSRRKSNLMFKAVRVVLLLLQTNVRVFLGFTALLDMVVYSRCFE